MSVISRAQNIVASFLKALRKLKYGDSCSRYRSVHINAKVKSYGLLKAKKIVTNSKHKHKSVYDLEQGKKIGKNGKLVDVKKIKDREHSNEPHSYIETVKDVETGEIIVNKDEKLSEHRED